MNILQNAKRTEPWVSVDHPDFRWCTGGDVQSTWRRYGWLPMEETKEHLIEKIITMPVVTTSQ